MYSSTVFLLFLSSFFVISFGFNLTILHFNDFHSRFEQTNVFSGACNEKLQEKKACFAGIARLKATIDQERAKVSNSLLLKGGDAFQGTLYYSVHKWKIVSHFLNRLGMSAMSLGNHEFDDGPQGLAPFLRNTIFPVLACNIDTSKERVLANLVKKSVVIDVGGKKVGIIGYITADTPSISNVGHVIFEEEVEAIKNEIQLLKKQGINIFIAVGHSGFQKDVEIAEKVPDIDAVVGGHTNTFLYSGQPPSVEKPVGDYPFIVTQPNGRKVPVVQAYAYGKYLGRLHLIFNDDGEVVSMSGSPLLLTQDLPEDSEIKRELEPFKEQVKETGRRVVGHTRVLIEGRSEKCRYQECSLGNLAADAFVAQFSKNGGPDGWSRVAIGVINGGGVRASISEGNVTVEDIGTSFPFGNTVDVVDVRGSTLKKMFEQSFSRPGEEYAGFLQVSGVRITYDGSKPLGKRVQEIFVRCSKCRTPDYELLAENEVYKIATATFLANGGDGYTVLEKEKLSHENSGILDFDAISEYFAANNPVLLGNGQRIRRLDLSSDVLKNTASLTGGFGGFFTAILFYQFFFLF